MAKSALRERQPFCWRTQKSALRFEKHALPFAEAHTLFVGLKGIKITTGPMFPSVSPGSQVQMEAHLGFGRR